jgi:glycosyltransferase involved in cell wall biosynthesis
MKSNKILFISHNATRTGAPIVLLTLLQYVKSLELFDFDILLIEGGELEKDFRKLGNVTVLHKPVKMNLLNRILLIFFDFKKAEINKYLKSIQTNKYDLVYANTILSNDVALRIKQIVPDTKIVLHLHELQYVISEMVGTEKFRNQLRNIDHVIAVSKAVQENLVSKYEFNLQDSTVIYEFSVNVESGYKVQTDIRKELGISDDTFVVGAAGEVQWRKGYDVFLLLARYYVKKYPNQKIHFIWLGQIYEHIQKQIDFDLEKMGMSDKVSFVGKKNNPMDYYSIFDVFTMVSREDPFPLVCLEVGALSKPIICFENAGGIPELIVKNNGFIVPYLDIVAMSEKINFLYVNNDELNSMCLKSREIVVGKFSKEKQIKSIIELIKKI